MASPSCLRLFWHLARAAAARTFCTAGNSRPIRMAMMAMTTNNSIRVNPERTRRIAPSFPRSEREKTNERGERSGNLEVDLVRAFRRHLALLLGPHAPLGRDEFLRDDVRPGPARA